MNVYLDHAASTPARPEAVAAYVEALGRAGNPSSIHADGRAARALLEDARERFAATVEAHPTEVVFTSGGTESVNIAVKGLVWGAGAGRDRIVTSPAEHHATLDAVEWLGSRATRVDLVPVDGLGRVRLDELARIIEEGGTRTVALLTLLWANNEIGTIEHTDAIADLAAELGAPLHWDAVAAFGHVPISFRRSGAQAMSVSGHKIGAPIGTGALLVRRGAEPVPLTHGGGQQSARSGTVDVAGAVALAVAAELAVAELAEESR
ncbi:MAG: aminotransferase class V-fold PLP-dependent enzyme, partial [Microbacteriaceae bacterium]|nr:aminotransferase class V-fold PLP-dependent enzyme [Microbacteriaceae bacterium]